MRKKAIQRIRYIKSYKGMQTNSLSGVYFVLVMKRIEGKIAQFEYSSKGHINPRRLRTS